MENIKTIYAELERLIVVDGYEPFFIRATKQILLPATHGKVEINVYGEYLCLIAQVFTQEQFLENKKTWRFQTDPILESNFTSMDIATFADKIKGFLHKPTIEGVSVHQFIPKIVIPKI